VGLTFPALGPGRSIYLWFDSLVGYGTLAARLAAQDPAYADPEFLHFFGKNIVFHHAILWPTILGVGLGGVPSRASAAVRGFMTAAAPDFSALPVPPHIAADYARLHCIDEAFDWPRDFVLGSERAAALIDRILIGKVAVHCRRLALACANGPRTADAGRLAALSEVVAPGAASLAAAAAAGNARQALGLMLDTVKAIARHLGRGDADLSGPDGRGEAAVALGYLLTLLAPFAPRIVDEFNIFENWSLGSIMDCESCAVRPLRARSLTWPRIGAAPARSRPTPEAVGS
jgi:hypothetical protein